MEHYKEMRRKYYKELLYNCQRSMEEEVSLQYVLLESEKKKDITTLEKLLNCVLSTSFKMISQMFQGWFLQDPPTLRQNYKHQKCLIKDYNP